MGENDVIQISLCIYTYISIYIPTWSSKVHMCMSGRGVDAGRGERCGADITIHTHTYKSLYIHIHTYHYTYMDMYVCVCIETCGADIPIHTHTYKSMYMYIHIHTYIVTCGADITIHTHTYKSIHIHAWSSKVHMCTSGRGVDAVGDNAEDDSGN